MNCLVYFKNYYMSIYIHVLYIRPPSIKFGNRNFHTSFFNEVCMSEYAAAAKSLQSCPTLCDPRDGSHQAPPSLGLSRQEHWSGLPFPSPMHESEK